MNMCRHVPLYLLHHASDLRPRSGLGLGPRWRASKEYGVNEVMAEVLLPSAATFRFHPGSLGVSIAVSSVGHTRLLRQAPVP